MHELDVWTEHLGAPVKIGRLSYEVDAKESLFAWSAEAKRLNLNLSPIRLSMRGVWSSRDEQQLPADYRGLPGMLNDSLPDGWGLYLMDKALARQNIPANRISPATRLAFLGDRAWGSLSFSPALGDDIQDAIPMGELGLDMEATIEGHLDEVSAVLLQAGSSPQGARPKVMVDCDESFRWARVSGGPLAPGSRSWLIKWAARDEPEDAPIVEQVYMESAREAGLTVMPSQLKAINKATVFVTERFDRTPNGRVFCHSLAGLLHLSHRDLNVRLDYGHIAEVMIELNVPAAELREGYMRAAFNAAMSVRDDHTKNVAFCLDAKGTWHLSPAYDLTYMDGPGGYHTLTFAEHKGRDPKREDLLRLATFYKVNKNDARDILDQMLDIASRVNEKCCAAGVSIDTRKPREQRLNAIANGLK
nr:type II toxin-antitoxin system HipA family toxin [Dyella acidiphila]